MNPLIAYTASFTATFLAAAAGSAASVQAGAFYGSLTKPPWAPPAWLFGPVWTVLYLMMAVAGGLAFTTSGPNARVAAGLFLVQLGANALWSWTFFKWQSGLTSMVTIAALWVLIVLTLAAFWRANLLAGALLVPYLLWVSFALLLNWTVWKLNPGLL